VLLRTAQALRASKIPQATVNRTLRQVRARLPADVPLSAALSVSGGRVTLRQGEAAFDGDSGQYSLSLEIPTAPASVHALGSPRMNHSAALDALAVFDQAYRAEENEDLAAARQHYAECLRLSPEHLEARVNYGRLLHLAGELQTALTVYEEAPLPDANLSFNRAVLLEDMKREAEAVLAYQEALAFDPACADAHFNLARLHERAGRARDSLRHLLAYRRLTR
jgi:tetratricopeptide (TPR) repeat protein